MCGATILPTSEVPVQPVRAAMPPASVPAPPTPHMEPPRVDSTRIDPTRIDAQRIAQRIDREPSRERQAESIPAISSPSFLGLNDPAPTRSADPEPRRASLSIDPHSEPPSRSLEYLLNDDDHNDDHGGGAGKIFVILFLVIALGVTGYLTWKNHGFGWITLGSNKPTAVPQNSPSADAAAPLPSITPDPSSSTAAPEPSTAATPQPAAEQPHAQSSQASFTP